MPNDFLTQRPVSSSLNNWRECVQCGLCSTIPHAAPGLVAACPRCHHVLWRMRLRPFQFSIACGLAGVLFYLFAIIAPFLEISVHGRFQLAGIETGPVQLAAQDFAPVALLVLAVSVIFPGLKLGIMLVTLLGLRTGWLSRTLLKAIFRCYEPMKPWAMIDVYLLGFLVAYTRLAAMASVHLDTALYALIGLMLTMAAADAGLDSEAVWRALDQADSGHGVGPASAPNQPVPNQPAPDQSANHALANHAEIHAAAHASQALPAGGIIGCHACFLVSGNDETRCRRCNARLRRRKPDALNRGWAFTIAAACLYLPANIYPVMFITKFAATQQFTILRGITELAAYGLWPLAALVFFASMTIPIAKLCILAYMLAATQYGSTRHLLGRTRAFRLINFIGRWSMIDVFMVSILVALVRFGLLANVIAAAGATCFAAVVVLTMFAVESFDPRLMWDVLETGDPA